MRLMVADAQLSFDVERGQGTNNHKTWAYSRDEYFKTDGDDDRADSGDSGSADSGSALIAAP